MGQEPEGKGRSEPLWHVGVPSGLHTSWRKLVAAIAVSHSLLFRPLLRRPAALSRLRHASRRTLCSLATRPSIESPRPYAVSISLSHRASHRRPRRPAGWNLSCSTFHVREKVYTGVLRWPSHQDRRVEQEGGGKVAPRGYGCVRAGSGNTMVDYRDMNWSHLPSHHVSFPFPLYRNHPHGCAPATSRIVHAKLHWSPTTDPNCHHAPFCPCSYAAFDRRSRACPQSGHPERQTRPRSAAACSRRRLCCDHTGDARGRSYPTHPSTSRTPRTRGGRSQRRTEPPGVAFS